MVGIFNASVFNNAVFNTGTVTQLSLQLGAGGEDAGFRKRQRFLVRIEDEDFVEVFSPEEAIALLNEAKKEKLEEVRIVAQEQAKATPTKRKEVLDIPQIRAKSLPPEAERVRQQINRELEIGYWLMFEQAIISMQEEEDDEELMLIL